jgi:hypothetical protein
MTRIYISSTYTDLVEHRQRVYDILRKMRYDSGPEPVFKILRSDDRSRYHVLEDDRG